VIPTFKIKFLVVDTWPQEKGSQLQMQISNTVNRVYRAFVSSENNNFAHYGLVHTALQIGPFIIHWVNTSLARFDPLGSRKALLAIDLGEFHSGNPEHVQQFKGIVNTAIQWNLTKEYDTKSNNSQKFARVLCKQLKLEAPEKSNMAFKKYFRSLKQSGEKKPFYVDSNKETITFNTHAELDNYCHDNYSTLYDSEKENGGDEWALLKSFDRAFYFKLLRENNNAYRPTACCPFGDPKVTGSFPLTN